MSDDRLVIDVIDNGGQWTHREWRMLRYLDVDTQILSNTTPLDELRELDGLVLSGGAARVGLTGELGNCAAYLGLDIPISVSVQGTNSWLDSTVGGPVKRPNRNSVQQPSNCWGEGVLSSPKRQHPKQSGRVITTRSSKRPQDSASQPAANPVEFKRWRTNHKIASASNSIQKSTIRSTARRFSRTLWKSAVGLARALFSQGAG